MLYKLDRIARSSILYETESEVSCRGLSLLSYTGTDREQRNFFVRNLLFVLRRSSTRSPSASLNLSTPYNFDAVTRDRF